MRRLHVVGRLLCFLSCATASGRAFRWDWQPFSSFVFKRSPHKPAPADRTHLMMNTKHLSIFGPNLIWHLVKQTPDVIWTLCVASEFPPVCLHYTHLRCCFFCGFHFCYCLKRIKRCHVSIYCQVVLMHVSLLSPPFPFFGRRLSEHLTSFPGDAFHRAVLPKKHPAYFSSKHNRSVGINDSWDSGVVSFWPSVLVNTITEAIDSCLTT